MKFFVRYNFDQNYKIKAAILVLLFLLVVLMLQTGFGQKLDRLMTNLIYNCLTGYGWQIFFIFLSLLGFGSVFGVVGVFIYFLSKDRSIAAIWYVLFAVILEILVYMIKQYFERLRPFETLSDMVALSLGFLDKFSFPSTHSAMAFFTAYFLAHRFNYILTRKLIIFGLALLIALSRVYLGVHYFFDVIAGALVGILLGIIAEYGWKKIIIRKS